MVSFQKLHYYCFIIGYEEREKKKSCIYKWIYLYIIRIKQKCFIFIVILSRDEKINAYIKKCNKTERQGHRNTQVHMYLYKKKYLSVSLVQ